MAKSIGIDLGTTNSAMAVVEDGDSEIIENDAGERTTPSVVRFKENDEVVVGKSARNTMVAYPEETVARVKQHMDEEWETDSIHGESYTPEQVSHYVLSKLKQDAEKALGEEVDSAVITVPAYFGKQERERTITAGKLAGLEVDRIINEPTAACLAYGLQEEDEEGTALVYDLGGGTFDATLVDIREDAVDVIETDGDAQLGGENYDDRVYEHIREKFIEAGNSDPKEDLQVKNQLRQTARQVKEDLSFQSEVEIALPTTGEEGLVATLAREDFENIVNDLTQETIDIVDDLFARVDYTPEDVDEILMVGGSTRIPQVREEVEKYFGREPSHEVNPDEVVAKGAATQAHIINRDTNEPLPGGIKQKVLMDVAPKSMGIKLHDGSFDPIISRGEDIPSRNSKAGFTTVEDNQTAIRVQIFEGESEVADENDKIDEFTLKNIPPQPAGQPEFEVTFEVDENNILHAEAENVDTGDSADIEVKGAYSISDEEVEKQQEELPGLAD